MFKWEINGLTFWVPVDLPCSFWRLFLLLLAKWIWLNWSKMIARENFFTQLKYLSTFKSYFKTIGKDWHFIELILWMSHYILMISNLLFQAYTHMPPHLIYKFTSKIYSSKFLFDADLFTLSPTSLFLSFKF